MAMRDCGACDFWAPTDDVEAPDQPTCLVGECRRRAPMRVDSGGLFGIWPLTKDGEWCGEFRQNRDDERQWRGVYDRLIGELPLSARAYHGLLNATEKIRTIGDLVKCQPRDLLKLKNFGRGSLRDVETALREIGLSLGARST